MAKEVLEDMRQIYASARTAFTSSSISEPWPRQTFSTKQDCLIVRFGSDQDLLQESVLPVVLRSFRFCALASLSMGGAGSESNFVGHDAYSPVLLLRCACLLFVPYVRSGPCAGISSVPLEHQGLLFDLGGALGFGKRDAFDGLLGLAWKGQNVRLGLQLGAGIGQQRGDDTTAMGGSFYSVEEDANIDVFHRFYVMPQLNLCIPLASFADLTLGGGAGPIWITKVSDRLVGGGNPMEDNPGLLVRAGLGVDIVRDDVVLRLVLGMEHHCYHIDNGSTAFDFSDPKFLLELCVDRLFRRHVAPRPPRREEAFAPAFHIPEAKADTAVGSRSPESILKVIRANIGDFQRIYESHLKENLGIGGKILLKFTISPAGDIIAISLMSSNTGDHALDEEIKARVRLMKFEPIEKGNVTVTYAFVLDNR
jgi:TonB family protein